MMYDAAQLTKYFTLHVTHYTRLTQQLDIPTFFNFAISSEQGTPHSSPHPTNDTKASLDMMSEAVSDSTIDRLESSTLKLSLGGLVTLSKHFLCPSIIYKISVST